MGRLGWALILAAAAGLSAGGPAKAQVFGTNLLTNPGAEAGAGSPSGGVVPVPGWVTTGFATAVPYGAAGGFPLATDPGPTDRGLNFFAGGPNNASSALTQSLDMSAAAAPINDGLVRCDLSGYLGGFAAQRDAAVVTATFLNATGGTLGSVSIGPVTAADRDNLTGLLVREDFGLVPAGTVRIDVSANFFRVDGSYNDGYADNLSVVLTPVPEPAGAALSAAAVLSAAGWQRFRARKRTRSPCGPGGAGL